MNRDTNSRISSLFSLHLLSTCLLSGFMFAVCPITVGQDTYFCFILLHVHSFRCNAFVLLLLKEYLVILSMITVCIANFHRFDGRFHTYVVTSASHLHVNRITLIPSLVSEIYERSIQHMQAELPIFCLWIQINRVMCWGRTEGLLIPPYCKRNHANGRSVWYRSLQESVSSAKISPRRDGHLMRIHFGDHNL